MSQPFPHFAFLVLPPSISALETKTVHLPLIYFLSLHLELDTFFYLLQTSSGLVLW